MVQDRRPLIYREGWVFPIMIAIAVFPWFMAAATIGDYNDEGDGWLLFASSFAAAMGAAIVYSIRLHIRGRLFPRTKAEADENRAKTPRSRSVWPVWLAIVAAIRLGPSWLQLVGLRVLSGVLVPFTVGVFLNAIRVPPTE